MMVFEIDLEAEMLVAPPRANCSFFVAAETEEEAIRIAKNKMKEKFAAKYKWIDDDENSNLISCYIRYMKCIENFENERN